MRGLTASRFGASKGIAAVLFGALVFNALLVAATAARTAVPIKLDGDASVVFHGFYPAEHDADQTFAWTHPSAEVSLPGLDRRGAWRWTARAALWRPPGAPLPRIRIAVDGIPTVDRALTHNFEMLDVTIPKRPDRSGETLTIDITPGFVPGPSDSRELGIALDSLILTPADRRPLPPWSAVLGGSAALVLLGFGVVLSGATAGWTLAIMLITAAAQTWTMTRGLAEYGPYAPHLTLLSFWIGLAMPSIIVALEKMRGERLSTTARQIVALSGLACYLKLAVLLHPMMPVGDGVFHAHRLEFVLGGKFYFTSVAPGDYAFPYPILLYLLAAPFSFLTSNTLDRVALLRIVVTAADGAVGGLLYWMIVRTTKDRVTGAVAVAWYHLIPATAWIMTWGNLTNAFGQALFVASLAAIVAIPVDRAKPGSVLTLAILAAAALLAHPSTCAILAAILIATTALYAGWGGARLRGAALGVGMATLFALTAAFVLYYAWFPTIYFRELGRATAETLRATGPGAGTPGVPVAARVEMIPALAVQYFGWPAMILAVVGAWRIRLEANDHRLPLVLVAWGGVSLVFLIIGLITPIQMRYHFAAFPALALTAAMGWSWAWRSRVPMRLVGLVALVAAVLAGLRPWMALLT